MVRQDEQRHRAVNDTADALHSAAIRLLRHARTADAGMDLDGPRASLLSVLVFGGAQPVGRLAQLEQVSPPAITKLVTALERDGLVQRIHSTVDRRVVEVAATRKGRERLERGRASRVSVIAGVLSGASRQDLATVRRAVNILAEALEKVRVERAGKA
jgi:DNA-binding MarR family transcriptional regulator